MKSSMRLIVTGILAFFCNMQYAKSQTIRHNSTGMHDGHYYSFWTDSTAGAAAIILKPKGRYKTKWAAVGNFTAGKGWAMGIENRVICYYGKFDGGSNGYLALYGWTKDSLIEYYVVENYGEWTPPGADPIGSFQSDGGTYNIYKTLRVNQPSIVGTATFYQYWSVRTSRRTKGTVTFANHVAAWKEKGMNLGKIFDYQIMETEGFQSTGSSDITVGDCTLKLKK